MVLRKSVNRTLGWGVLPLVPVTLCSINLTGDTVASDGADYANVLWRVERKIAADFETGFDNGFNEASGGGTGHDIP